MISMKYIDCPVCGMTLIKLNFDEHYHEYWCDICKMDITVKEEK